MWFFKKKKEGAIVKKKNKIGLALGGGSARGIGHIGVIKALNELGIEPDFVCGTSVGSIIGSLVALGFSGEKLEEVAIGLKQSDIIKKNVFFTPSSTDTLEATLLKIYGKDIVFSELNKPFAAVAVNLKNGEEVRIESGSVARACCASSAIPGIFKPVVYRGMHLVDGGLANNVPADVVREMGANIVIAVDVNPLRGKGTESLKLTKVLSQMVGVMMQKNIDAKLRFADIVIIPNLGEFPSNKMSNTKEMIKRGYDAVMEKKDEILKLLRKKPRIKDKVVWRINKKKK